MMNSQSIAVWLEDSHDTVSVSIHLRGLKRFKRHLYRRLTILDSIEQYYCYQRQRRHQIRELAALFFIKIEPHGALSSCAHTHSAIAKLSVQPSSRLVAIKKIWK